METNKKIVIVGGSGFIGTKLTEALLGRGYGVTIIDLVPPRMPDSRVVFIKANIAKDEVDPKVIDGCFGIVNLAGATIGKRWSTAYQELIYSSRIDTTKAIVDLIAKMQKKPSVLVSASAAGYYGDQGSTLLREDHAPGNDFLAHVCVDWEAAAMKAKDAAAGIRVALIRTANVLGPGGLLVSLLPLFKKGLGGYFSSGRQYMPWIYWKDVVGIYLFAIEHPLEGPYNVGAGQTISQKELFTAFAKVIHAPVVWRVPLFAARIGLGKFADALVASQNTDSTKIRNAGYVYQVENVTEALSM